MSVRPPRQSVRPSLTFWVLVATTVAGGALAWLSADRVQPLAYAGVFVLVLGGWLVSLCLHEFGHAYTAWRYGDHGVAARGYLTLDPRRYSHPLLSLGLPVLFIALGGIGLPGGAVYLQTAAMTRRQQTVVSLAGPAMNVVLAVILLATTRLLFDPAHAVFWAGVAFLAFLQVTAVLLNLLPVPGLDGYGALEPHLSPQARRALEPVRQWAFLLLLVVLLTPPLNQWFFSAVYWAFDLSGVPSALSSIGGGLTRFWSAWM